MRHFVRAAELCAAGLDWLKVLMGESLSGKTLAVARFKTDPKLPTEADRVQGVRRRLEIGIESGPTWGPESALKRDPPQWTS